MLRRSFRCPLIALSTISLLVACGSGDKAADSARAADSAAAAASAATPAPPPPPPTLTDANILAKLDAANAADSAAGALAVSMGTAASVKEYARMMMTEHHALRVEGLELGKKASITPELPPGDVSAAETAALADSMKAMPAGAGWDKFYIDHEVTAHEKVLAFAQEAANNAQNADLKAMIQRATPAIQKHLDKAKEIQGKLATP